MPILRARMSPGAATPTAARPRAWPSTACSSSASPRSSWLHNQDNREHDVLDSDDYYQFEGGITAAVRHLSGDQPEIYHNDHSRPETPRIRTLKEEIGRIVRARAVNPKWLNGVMRHGYKGAFEIAATVDYLFVFAATARVVENHHFDALYEAYVRITCPRLHRRGQPRGSSGDRRALPGSDRARSLAPGQQQRPRPPREPYELQARLSFLPRAGPAGRSAKLYRREAAAHARANIFEKRQPRDFGFLSGDPEVLDATGPAVASLMRNRHSPVTPGCHTAAGMA